MFCVGEEKNPVKVQRERYEVTKVKSTLSILNVEENEKVEDEVGEIIRLGSYEEGKNRPLMVKLKS